MNLAETRNELSIRGKNGIGFLLSGLVIWIIITVVFTLPIGVYEKSIFMLFSTGLMFPVSIGLSRVIRADWKLEGNSLGTLGMYLNLAQIMYFPLLFWAIGNSPEEAVMFFAIITGAHFFPYGWFYQSKAYSIMSPIISLAIMFIGWNIGTDKLWVVPLAMVFLLVILIFWLYMDYRNKSALLQHAEIRSVWE